MRDVLSHFLKSRRARLRPEECGLPTSRRRRLHGLRREEVAALAGVGNTWYGLLESGKRIQVSAGMIESIGSALRLTNEERHYFQTLVVEDSSGAFDYEHDEVPETVRRSLASIAGVPAFVIGPRLDYLATNALVRSLYDYPPEADAVFANLILRVFLSPRAKSLYPHWDATAARTVSKFRRFYGKHIGNESFERLIARLTAESVEFRRIWDLHDVATLHDPISEELVHPAYGTYRYQLQAYDIPNAREQALVMMLPLSADDAALLARLQSVSNRWR